ncbi:MAG: Gfo/Idh/MocA family oxidoreductase [Rhodothermales bacterium]
MSELNRRTFLKTSSAAVAGASLATGFPTILKGQRRDVVRVATVGVRSRGKELTNAVGRVAGGEVVYVCDVDVAMRNNAVEELKGFQDTPATALNDFREALADDSIDAVVIAMPDHWHAPAAIMAMQAGKHVYVEKPGSQNAHEGKLIAQAAKKYNRVVQLGTQQRSDGRTQEAIRAIREGLIGDVYYAKCWYANKRDSIGFGKIAPPPDGLDYELWQGPAPRQPYQDNLIHYNWHWFRHYGTGESCNNATHEMDVCRWALGVDYPTRATSSGGRYHYHDDWEFFDTQVMSFEFGNDKSITWEGRSCNPMGHYGRGRGSTIHGTKGTLLIDRDGYIFTDMDGKELRRNVRGQQTDQTNTVGGGNMTDDHMANFFAAITDAAPLAAPIEEGQKSVLLCHLGNVAQFTGRSLYLNPTDGSIIGDRQAMDMWSRDYEPGWAPVV